MPRAAIRRRRSITPRTAAPTGISISPIDEVKALANAGKLGDDRVLTVRTGLDTGLQQKTEERASRRCCASRRRPITRIRPATVVADTNGLVRAIVGGRDYGASQFNRATDALRQPGSSFKVIRLSHRAADRKISTPTPPIDASGICIGDYCVHNYEGERGGRMPLYTRSRNPSTPRRSGCRSRSARPIGRPSRAIIWRKIAALGRTKIVETARAMGLTTPLADTVSLPVGADEVKMIDMVGANAMLANGGKRATPSRRDRNPQFAAARVIYTHEADGPPPEQVDPGRQDRRDEQHHDPCRDRGHRPRRANSRPRRSPARPARRTIRPTPGSTASPAISSAASGSATTTIRRWTT